LVNSLLIILLFDSNQIIKLFFKNKKFELKKLKKSKKKKEKFKKKLAKKNFLKYFKIN
jgi:hypothetical protein